MNEDEGSLRGVEANFRRDWVEYLMAQLSELHCRVDPTRDAEEIAIAYFNALKRRVLAKSRSVARSSDLSCPIDYQRGLDHLVAKVERGEDLTSHLSTAIEQHAEPGDQLFNDGLLNDWGIHHFHLGTVPDPKNPRFVSRTNDVLFARVTDTVFHMITIMPHRDARGRGNWACQRLIRIIHRDWPESIEHLRLPFAAVDPVPTDEEMADYRKARVMVAVTMSDGTIYRPLGGGYATSGTGIDVADAAAYFTHAVSWVENDVRKNADKLAAKAAGMGHSLGWNLRFRFVAFMPGRKAYVIEENSKVLFSLSVPF